MLAAYTVTAGVGENPMSTLIRTDDVSAADRLDYVREITAATWVPMDCRTDAAGAYWGVFRASGLGPLQVVVMDVMPITVIRTPELIEGEDLHPAAQVTPGDGAEESDALRFKRMTCPPVTRRITNCVSRQ